MSRYIQEPRSKEKKKEKLRTLPKPGSYAVKDLEDLKKKVLTYQGGRK